MLTMDRRTRGWYLIRLELAIGLAAVLVVPLLLLVSPSARYGMFVADRAITWAPSLFVLLAGFAGMLVGLVWMVRIARGPRDAPPAWRYRADR
jgi:hypothetical protein